MSLERCPFRSSAHFLIGLFAFLVLGCISCLYRWKLILCQLFPLLLFPPILSDFFFIFIVYIAINFIPLLLFSHFKECCLHLVYSFLSVQKLLSLISAICLFLFSFPLLQNVDYRGSCCDLYQRVLCLYFPLKVL